MHSSRPQKHTRSIARPGEEPLAHGEVEEEAAGPAAPAEESAAHAQEAAHEAGGHETPAHRARIDDGLGCESNHAVLKEYIPFIVLLFSLYVIAGGIVVRGDIRATPLANTTIIGIGGVLASFIGTTGSAMLLIRFLLKTNSERKRKVHTVIFFIFIAANIGGTLLPIGDPPLFLGYLRGVPFFWTFRLWSYWAIMLFVLLVIYFVWDTWAYKHEMARSDPHGRYAASADAHRGVAERRVDSGRCRGRRHARSGQGLSRYDLACLAVST